MGVAIRGKHMLNLDLPSIVWKQLVGADITIKDLEGTVVNPRPLNKIVIISFFLFYINSYR